MASLNLTGILRDPTGEFSYKNQIRFTHSTTTGQTLAGFQSIELIEVDGAYDINVEYGNVLIETWDYLKRTWLSHGELTINSETPATDLPTLLGITTPVTDPDLLVIQLLVAEAAESADEAAISAAETVNFNKSITNSPAFVNAVDIVTTQCTLKVNVDDVVYTFAENTVVQMPTLTAGTDYAIYATSGGLIASDNFTMPSGYTEANSRRIGGFHYGDSFIYPYSFWDLKFRPTCDDPRGMVRTFQGFWADIYLLNNTPDLLGTSAYNATIADGASTPKIPAVWGGNGVDQYSSFTQYLATEVLAAYGKRLPFSAEFEVLAMGSVAGHANGTDPITTQFDVDARSLIGCEQVSGHLHQWGAEKWDRGDGLLSYAWREEDTNGEGEIYSAIESEGVGASLFGARWNAAGSAGSRASNWSNEPWYSTNNVSARGVCDHLQLL